MGGGGEGWVVRGWSHNLFATKFTYWTSIISSTSLVYLRDFNYDVMNFIPVQIERGHIFESDTDTEVIPKLLKYLYYSQVGVVIG